MKRLFLSMTIIIVLINAVSPIAALIVSENEPGIVDALEILKKLAGLPSTLQEV